MTLEALAQHVGIELFVGDPTTVADPLGVVGASPNAQACRRGVCADESMHAYSVLHEMAHILVGFDKLHSEVFKRQAQLAAMLDEPARSKAMPNGALMNVVEAT